NDARESRMTDKTKRGTRWRLIRDVIVFQIKLGMEAVLDITLIPVSLAAAGLDFVFGHWRQPRYFHAVLRFGERCEGWIDLWGAGMHSADDPAPGVDLVMRSIEAIVRNPRTGTDAVRALRRWAAMKLAPDVHGGPPQPAHKDDAAN
ncbi:MAG TPA: hypothetical protein VF277_08175, partial [Steroidobacteraceae bacterium]